jgi:hypothetical protein
MITKYTLFVESLNLFGSKHIAGKHYTFDECKSMNFTNEPTTLEGQIQFSIKWYPTLFNGTVAREQVLSHLFLTVGSGYDWSNDGIKLNVVETDIDDVKLEYKKFRFVQDQEKDQNEIKRLTEYIKNIKKYLDYEKNESEKEHIRLTIKENEDEILKLQHHIDNFDPFYVKYTQPDKPIDKIPWAVSIDQVNEIPVNAHKDYIDGFYEILDFYSQKRFKNDSNYNVVLNMKKALVTKFKL